MSFEPSSAKSTVSSTFGRRVKVTVFGGSHEPSVGVTIVGLPPGLPLDMERMQRFLDRRAPGRSPYTSSRREADIPIITQGISSGKTTGEALTILIQNTDARSADYRFLRDIPRPGHADYTASCKYGGSVALSGGGPFSARMTAPLCAAGSIALQLLQQHGILIGAHLLSAGSLRDRAFDPVSVRWHPELLTQLAQGSFPVLDDTRGEQMKQLLLEAASDGDSVGGIVECCALGLPPGLGGPMYDGLESILAPIYFGIPAVKGVEFGAGFASASLRGSENNDPFYMENGAVWTKTNRHGGILGGITSGMPLISRLAFKPTPSIAKPQQSVSLSKGTDELLTIAGRHDPCVALRAVPVTEAATALGLLDLMMEEERIY